MEVKNLAEVQKSGNTNLNIVIYGDAGSGKTWLAGSAAELGRVLFIDIESGSSFLPEKYSKNIDIMRIDNIKEADDVFSEQNIAPYNTIVIDSITEFAKKMNDHIRGGKETLTVQDWGKSIDKLETFFRRFRDLDKNCILVALSQEREDGEILVRRPSLSGKSLPANIVGYNDICIYLVSNKEGRTGFTHSGDKFWAKDRTGRLPEQLKGEELTLSFIYKTCVDYHGASRLCTKEEIEGLQKLGEQAKITEEGWVKALKFVGAKDIGALTMSQMLKLTASLEEKIKLIK